MKMILVIGELMKNLKKKQSLVVVHFLKPNNYDWICNGWYQQFREGNKIL